MIEFVVGPNARLCKHAVGEIDWPKDAVAGAVIRGDNVIIPPDASPIQPGDHVIVVSALSAIPSVERIFKSA